MKYRIIRLLAFLPFCMTRVDAQAPPMGHRYIGAYFFGGWRRALDREFGNLKSPQFAGREPTTGWTLDDSTAFVRQSLIAAGNGIDFFVVDWYFTNDAHLSNEVAELNASLISYLRSQQGSLKVALLWANHSPFKLDTSRRDVFVKTLVALVSLNSDKWLRVDGRIMLVVFDPQELRSELAGSVRPFLDSVRTSVRNATGVGLLIGAALTRASAENSVTLRRTEGDGYDFLTSYHFNFLGQGDTTRSFEELTDSTANLWRSLARATRLSFVPTAAVGWDPRPWRGDTAARYNAATVQEAEQLGRRLQGAVSACEDGPQLKCLAFVYAWNELGEGAFLVPSRGDTDASLSKALLRGFRQSESPNNVQH
jgi:hypothetical protein